MKKRIFSSLVIVSLSFTNSFSFDLPAGVGDYIKGILDGVSSQFIDMLSGQLNDMVTTGGVSACYVKEKDESSTTNIDFCGYLKTDVLNTNICKNAPDLSDFGLIKIENTFADDKSIQDLCNDAEKYVQSTITDFDVYARSLNMETAKGMDNRFEMNSFISKKDSIVRNAFVAGNQNVLKFLRDQTEKNDKIDSINKLKLSDLGVPKKYSDYKSTREQLANSTIQDYLDYSIVKASAAMRNEAALEKEDDKKLEKTTIVSAEYRDKIDANTNRRIQSHLDIYAKDDDYAMPTQEMVDMLTDEAKIEAIVKIREQQKREALIISEIRQIDNSRKNILTLIAQKSAIVSKEFPRNATLEEIENSLQKPSTGG